MTKDNVMKFRKKPIVIEAMQLPLGADDASEELLDFLHSMPRPWNSERDGSLVIHTLEGDMMADPEDWIIRGVKGEFYPCKPDIFEATYEAVDG